MNYFLDKEFCEDGKSIMPISLALVEEGGRSIYLEYKFNEKRAMQDDFVRENVLPHLRFSPEQRCTIEEIRQCVEEFLGVPKWADEPKSRWPLIWAYHASTDWVSLYRLWGRMVDMPRGIPRHCMDLQQWWVQLGRPEGVKPPKPADAHDALADARWNLRFHENLSRYEAGLVMARGVT